MYVSLFIYFSGWALTHLKFDLATIGRVEGLLDYSRIRSDMARYAVFVVTLPEPDTSYSPHDFLDGSGSSFERQIVAHCE